MFFKKNYSGRKNIEKDFSGWWFSKNHLSKLKASGDEWSFPDLYWFDFKRGSNFGIIGTDKNT